MQKSFSVGTKTFVLDQDKAEAAFAAKKVIKLSHSHQADFASEIHTAAWIFQKWIEDNSDTLEVKIYAANALGEERAVYEGMQLGSGASAVISATGASRLTARISRL